ncbi:hypothetical protein BDQ17DRAFT_222369 [Cyathus striatus]|nr:hypothetical protein BDQ17DRAFT_222369 [Cyathus striatus]
MFKRIEKRRRRKEEEEGLGLNEEMKDVLGLQDTDSDESNSSEDSDSSDEDLMLVLKMKDRIVKMGKEEEDLAKGLTRFLTRTRTRDDESETEESPDVTVGEALKDPVYLVSLDPDIRACVLCPGKLLKGEKMIDLHRNSNAHKRRTTLFIKLAKDADLKERAWDVLKRNAEEQPNTPQKSSSTSTSKRAEKREANQARWKARREKGKARQKANKKNGENDDSSVAISKSPKAAETLEGSKSSPSKTKLKSKLKTSKDTIASNDNSASSQKAAARPSERKEKKRKLDASGSRSTDELTSVKGKSVKKPKIESKEKKEQSATVPRSPGNVKGAENASVKKTVKAIAKSASDRAKQARSKALGNKKSK